ncbi:MAG: hydroxymyristoyl-ACP dehydratase [Xanthomonadaceae bacterium]|nr:hydroxymyristoyl-ACP dehydratase [Xanthomonadaceae bacterium]
MNGFARRLCIDAGHPALPGHFPGEPLVPAVVLLEQVALALRAWRRQRMTRVLEAKFVAPLRPGEAARIHLSDVDGARLRFTIECDGRLLARGLVEGAA